MRWIAIVLAGFNCGSWLSLVAGEEPFGWRRDGSGVFANVQPATTWKGKDAARWKAVMPDWSNSSPIVVGERIFVSAEPTRLVAIDRKTGKILWQAENGYDLVFGKEQLAQIEQDAKRADELRAERDKLRKQIDELHKQRREAGETEQKRYDKLIEPLEKQSRDLEERFKPLEKFRLTGRSAGYSTATPISDGEHVFVLFGTGVAAAYDLEGKRQWIKYVDLPPLEWGHTASPLLVKGRLVAHFNDMVALDAKSGDERWRSKVEPCYGSPVSARVGDTDVLVTAKGSVVAADDGRVLGEKLVKGLSRSSPVVHGQVAYFIEEHAHALRLPDRVTTPLKTEVLWESKIYSDNYFSSAVYLDGLLYAVSEKRTLTVLDATDGTVVSEQKLRFKQSRGPVVSSLAVADGKLYVINEEGTTLVLRTGREPEQLSENPLDGLRSSPVFAGRELLIRCNRDLYSLGE